MAKISQIVIPFGAQAIGQQAPVVSGLLPVNLAGYLLDFTNDASWPATGDVLQLFVDWSGNGGNTWTPHGLDQFNGVWVDKQGNTINTAVGAVGFRNGPSALFKLRIRMNVLQACNFGVTLSSV